MQIVNRLRATPRPEEQIFLPNDEKWPPLPFRGPKDLQTKGPLTEGALRFHSEGAELLKITSARRVSLRFVAAEQISQAAAFLAALPQCSHSRAVETALGQGMARSMCHSQARKRSKPHRGFAKKALSRPLPEKLADAIFLGALSLKLLLQARLPCAAGPNLPHT